MIEPTPGDDHPQERLRLFSGPCDRTSPVAVRQRLAALSQGPVPTRLVGDCQLIATELLSNAVKAGSDWVDVELLLFDDYVELWVADEAEGVPELRRGSLTDTGGRGLQIVAAIASAWGYRSDSGRGKTVWARLHVPGLSEARDEIGKYMEEIPGQGRHAGRGEGTDQGCRTIDT